MWAADLCGKVFRAEGAGNAKTPGATSLSQLRAASGRGRGAGGGRTPRRRRARWPTRLTSHSPSAPLPTPARDTSREAAKPRHPHAAERVGHRTRTTRPKESNRPDLNPTHKKTMRGAPRPHGPLTGRNGPARSGPAAPPAAAGPPHGRPVPAPSPSRPTASAARGLPPRSPGPPRLQGEPRPGRRP